VVSTQCFKYKAKWSSSVDTRSGSVDTRDSSQKTFWPNWDSVSTLVQVVSTLEAIPEHLLGCFGTCRHTPYWCRHNASNTRQNNAKTGQVVSTLDQVVSTLETAPRKPSGQTGTVCRH
ncbi:hypothetical protein Taro_037945, partial [Colocasia esculenta]|nr:hypothetical protein [Colocasia esculenta]